MPRPRTAQVVKLHLVVASPLVALATAGGLVSGLLEIARNEYLQQRLLPLAASSLRDQVNRDLLFALLVCLVAFPLVMLLMRLGPLGGCLTLVPYAGLVGVLASRVMFDEKWRTGCMSNGLVIPSLFCFDDLLRKAGILAAATLCLTVLLALYLWRRRADPSLLWKSQTLSLYAGVASIVTLLTAGLVNAAGLIWRPRAPARPVNVIYLTWDSARADHLSCYGYPKPTTPNLDELCRDATVFTRAYGQHNWTRTSYASIMAGLPDWALPRWWLDRRVITVAELLKNAGYQTSAIVQNPNLDPELNVDQGFDRFNRLSDATGPTEVNRLAMRELRRLSRSRRPFFLFAHYQGPHWPYSLANPFLETFLEPGFEPVAPERVRQIMKSNGKDWNPKDHEASTVIASMLQLYDAAIRETDEALGEVLDTAKELGHYENSLIVFNSDHGDEFGEHGTFGHSHKNLHPEVTHVPLVVRFPGGLGAGGRVDLVAQSLDILPTVLKTVGLEHNGRLAGDPLPTGGGSSRTWEGQGQRLAYSNFGALMAVRDGRFSLIVDHEQDAVVGFYDTLADPLEQSPLREGEHETALRRLQEAARRWYSLYSAAPSRRQTQELSEDLTERLRSLGYVE